VVTQLLEVIRHFPGVSYNVLVTTPSHIGQYRIVRKIGAGGMGMVFLGEHMLLGRRAAIKTLLPTVAINEEIVERFFNEARAASAISDPGVIQIFDFGYHVDGTAYIVMELLEGEALSARIDRLGKLPLPDALRIARQIAGSLAAAHACNVVHRDLKPDNIFIVRDVEAQGGERTKILDFGICKVGATDVSVTQAGAMVGTPVYMSPEQCRGTSDVDHRSDIYAFGCLLFHMLTGRPPFVGDSSGDLIVAHMQADPPAPSLYVAGLPFEIDALVLRCLAKAAEERFSSMDELHLVLGDIHAQLDTTESTVAAVTPAMQLGQGFRSVYDANFASRISPATHRLRPPLPLLATPPVTPPKHQPSVSADFSDDDELAALLRPRRTAARAVFFGLVLTGVVIGLMVMPPLDHEDRSAEAGTGPVAAAPIERAPASIEAPAPAAAPAVAASMLEPVPPVEEATSQIDRTVERSSTPEPASAPAAPTVAAHETRPTAETKPPEAKKEPVVSKNQATKGPVVSTSQVAPASKPAESAKPSGNAKSTEETARPTEPVKPTESAKPETRSAVETELRTDGTASETDGKAHVTTLTKPEPAPPAKPAAPRSRPTTSSSRPASPPSPPASPNEDLYDTR